MIQLKHTKKRGAISESEFKCEFCNRVFKRETSLVKHICETKRRWQEQSLPANRIAFQLWLNYYSKMLSKKPRTYLEFSKSSYYLAFLKFAKYCIESKVVNIPQYSDWLIKNNIGIDRWCTDSIYDTFLVYFLRIENPLDAIARSIETTINLAEQADILPKDYLRYGNPNRIIHNIINGKISPWMLYHCDSGHAFLGKIDAKQQEMISEYINPDLWALKFFKNPEDVKEVKNLLTLGGY